MQREAQPKHVVKYQISPQSPVAGTSCVVSRGRSKLIGDNHLIAKRIIGKVFRVLNI